MRLPSLAFARATALVVTALVLTAFSAGSASAETLAGKHCGPLNVGGQKVRFLLSGSVACGTATSIYTAYVHKASRGECEGNGCFTHVRGWACVQNISAPLREETGEVANCGKKTSGIRVFEA
jgi:hypothetical protein